MGQWTEEQLLTALRNAHNAGDTEAATRIARMVQDMRDAGQTDNRGREVVQMQQNPGESREAYRQRVLSAIRNGQRPIVQQSEASAEADRALEEDIQTPDTSLYEQTMSGVNEGITGLLGFPVDAATALLNAGASGINAMAGTEIPKIDNPVGGSQMLTDPLEAAGVISDVAPQTAAQRYGRSIGRDVGASVVPVGIGARAMQGAGNLARLGATELASSVGSGAGAQAAEDLFPESTTAQVVGGLLGGGLPIAVSAAMRPRPQAPSVDDLSRMREEAYQAVEGSGTRVTQESRDGLLQRISDRMSQEHMDQYLHPRASRTLRRLDELPDNPTIWEIEQRRQLVGRDVAGAAEEGERRLGVIMKNEIDDYLASLERGDVIGSDPSRAMDNLQTGRELTGRLARADAIGGETGAVTRAIRRASTSGTGGNEVNAIRQNIRAILDNPTKRRGFSPEEIRAMEEIVEGTPTTNALRLVGRMSPTSGALPAMAGIGAGFAAASNPLYVAPSTAGLLAKSGAERLTRNQVLALDELVRNGAPLAPRAMADYERAVAGGLLGAMGERATE